MPVVPVKVTDCELAPSISAVAPSVIVTAGALATGVRAGVSGELTKAVDASAISSGVTLLPLPFVSALVALSVESEAAIGIVSSIGRPTENSLELPPASAAAAP